MTVNKIFDIRKCTKIIKAFKWFYLCACIPTPKINYFFIINSDDLWNKNMIVLINKEGRYPIECILYIYDDNGIGYLKMWVIFFLNNTFFIIYYNCVTLSYFLKQYTR